jgi:hypothetical protein
MLRVAIWELGAHEPLVISGALVITYNALKLAICDLLPHEPLLTSGALVIID